MNRFFDLEVDMVEEPVKGLVERLRKQQKEAERLRDIVKRFDIALELFNEYEIGESYKVRLQRNDIAYTLHHIDKEIKEIGDKIEVLQGECEHKFTHRFSDSHHDYYRCEKCGKFERF
jgi:hypothetical protein